MRKLTSLPINLSRRARMMLLAMLHLADEDTGEVVGGYKSLASLLGISDTDSGAMSRAFQELESYNLIRRVFALREKRRVMRVFVMLPDFRQGACENCYEPTKAGRWCPRCKQGVGRADRAWQTKAIMLAVNGKTPPEIAVALDRPLWRTSDDDQRKSGSAVVPFLIEQGLIDERWNHALRRALRGEDSDE